MAERNYTVKYDIIANATQAIETFNSLKTPLNELKRNSQKLSASLTTTVTKLIEFEQVLNRISASTKSIEIKVGFDIASFNRNLKEMELNAKTSAARIRGTFESIFKDTHGDYMKKQSLLGTPIKQHVSKVNSNMSKEVDEMLKASETLSRKVTEAARQHQIHSAFKKNKRGELFVGEKGYELLPGGEDILRRLYGDSKGLSKMNLKSLIARAASDAKSVGIALTQAEMTLWESLNGIGTKASVKGGNLSFGGTTLGDRGTSIQNAIKERRDAIISEKASLQKEWKDIKKNQAILKGGQAVSPGQPFLSNLSFNPKDIIEAAKVYEKMIGSIGSTPVEIKVRLAGLSEVKEQFTSFVNGLNALGESKLFSPASSVKYKNPNSFPLTAKLTPNPQILAPNIARMLNTEDGYNSFQYYAKSGELWGEEAARYERAMENIENSLVQKGMIGKGNRILKPNKDYYPAGDQRRYSPTSVMVLEKLAQEAASKGMFNVPERRRYASPLTSIGSASEKFIKSMTVTQANKGAGEFVINVSGNYKQHMASLAEFATSLPLLKSKNVEVNIGVAGLSKEAVSQIKNIQVPKEAKVMVPLSLSYKNARDMVPRTLGVLQKIVNDRGPLKVKAIIDNSNIGLKNPKNAPTISVKAKVTGLTSAVREANTAFQNRAKAMKNAPAIRIPIQLKWGTGQENMQAQIKKMQSSIPALKVGVNLELAKAQIDELAAYIQKKGIINLGGMSGAKSQGQFRNYRPGSNEGVSYAGGGGGGRGRFGGSSGGMVYGGSGEGNFLTRLRRFAYPLTGNLSYGASSPMALQMFKDMPIMMGVGGAIGAITGGISNSFEYQDTMRVARSILERGYKGDNFERDYRNMEVTARNVARATKFTAPEAAEAVRFMAMAGLDIPRINSSIKPISDIALIGRNNLGEIADIMTNVQTTYKISPDKMERMADAMANTFTKTNVDMMMIAESLKYAGGIAQLTGTSLGDSLAMIGIMGNNGIQGSMAGTSTRMMMQNMIRPNKNQAAIWAKIGVNTRDENGFVKDPIKLLGELRGYVDKKYGSDAYMKLGKGEEFKNKALGDLVSNMFRVTSTAGVAALLRDYDKLVQLSTSNRSSDINGLAGQLSEKQQNEVKGLIAKISSSFQEQILQIIEKNTGWIKQKLVDINEWVSSPETQKKLESLIDTLKNIVQGFINVGKVALWAYEKFNKIKIFGDGLVDTLIKFQLYMSALGSALRLVLSPLNIFSGFNFGGMGAAGAASSIGRIIASSKPRAFVNAIGQRVYNTENDGLAPITTVYNSGSYKKPYSRGWYSPLGQMPVVLGPIGARNLRDEQQALATINPIQQRIALYQRSRSYMTRGMTKKQKALQYASIDRQVASMRSQIASARTAAFNETLAFGIMSNAFPLLYRRTSPVIHGRTTVPFAYNREMRPMPFYQYAKNASAIKYGGAPIAEYASEYRKRAGMYATMALSGKDYKKHAEHMRLAEMYRKAAQQAEWMQIQERKAALERMKKAAMASRRPRQLLDSELISAFIMSRGFKRSKGLIGESLKANFRAGKAFGAFKGVAGFEGLASSVTSGVMGLAKAMGLLLSPIGLATLAIGALGTAAYMLYRRNKENKNALQRDIDGMKKIRDLTNNNNGFNASALPDSSPLKIGIARVSANSGVISQGAVKNNPLLKNNPFFRRVLAPENNLNASVYQKYAGTLYDEFIANGFNRYSESPLAASAFQDASGTFKQGPEAYRFLQSKALQGAAMLQGGSSNRVNAWTNYIKKQSEKIFAIKDADKRNKAWEDLENRINEVSERYKKQAENLKSVTDLQKKYGDNLKNARSSEIMNTSEYRFAEARAVGNLMKNMGNGAIGQYLATHVLDAGVKDKTGTAIRAIVNGMQIGITGSNGKELVSSLSFTKNGGVDWGKLQETLKKNGVDFELTVGNKMSIISSLLEQIKGNPYYKDVTNYLEKIYQEQRREQEIKDIVAESYNRIIGLTPWGKGNDGGNGSGGDGNPDVPSPIKPAPKKSIFSSPWHLSSYSTAEGMGNNRYMANASYGGGFSNKNNVVVNVGGISVYNDADMNEIEQRIEKGVVTAMSAVLVDQSNNSMYNI